jgi:type VI protein secretion system component VasK
MKKLMSIVVSVLFALSLSGLAFAQAPKAEPKAEPAKAEEKAPAKEKKAKKARRQRRLKRPRRLRRLRRRPPKRNNCLYFVPNTKGS